jgi:hypothetical protein
MLPASFQTPAAVVLVAGGVLACFAGYRLFRIVLGIFGFILGALVASSLVGADNTGWMILAAVLGGLAGGLILVAAYFVGVALLGAGLGALAVNLIAAQMGREPHVFVVIALAIIGALGALALQRYVIIVSTSYGGAWTTIVGALTMIGDPGAVSATARGDVWLAYPVHPGPGTRWLIVIWIVLGTLGVIVQLMVTGKVKRKK